MHKITDKTYIGDVEDIKHMEELAMKEEEISQPIDSIVNVSGYCPDRTIQNHYTWINIPLKDGQGNQNTFNAAVRNTEMQVQEGKTVLVNCAAGISRSSAVLATALASIQNTDFRHALEQIKQVKPGVNPKKGLKNQAEHYLENF